jgi:Transglutaminase-like superfamily
MPDPSASSAEPQRRLIRTRLKRARNLRRFAKPVPSREILADAFDAPADVHPERQETLLYDVVVALHRDGTASYRHHTVARVFGDRELAEWDHLSRVDQPRRSRQTIRSAFVHLPDGRRVRARRVHLPLEHGSRLINLTFHPLRPGVVIEFDEQLDEFRPSEFGPGLWYRMLFRTPDPRRRVRFTAAVADPFAARFQTHHLDTPPTEWRHREYTVRQWNLRGLSGFDPDEWTPPPAEFLPWVDVTTLTSWAAVQDHYRREIALPDGLPADLRDLTHELADPHGDARGKAAALYDYATRTIRYGRSPAEEFRDAPRKAGEMLADLRGDCKDKSALLVAMLREAGVPAQAVLVQTTQQGRFAPLPAPWFDHAVVLARVDGEDVWLDPAGGPSTFGELPYHDHGVPALVLGNERAEPKPTPPATPEQHVVERRGEGTLDELGGLHCRFEATVAGHRAGEIRLMCAGMAEERQKRAIARNESDDLPSIEISDVHVSGIASLTEHVGFEYRLDIADWCRRVGELCLLRLPWRNAGSETAAGSDAGRPVPFVAPNPAIIRETLEITLPRGVLPYDLPAETTASCDWGRFTCSVSVAEGILTAKREVRFLGGIVPPDRFTEWRQFRDAIVRADDTDVVLLSERAAAALDGESEQRCANQPES